jgi:hypothetical protein
MAVSRSCPSWRGLDDSQVGVLVGADRGHASKDDTQVKKQLVENESFKRFVGDMAYAITNP